MKTKILLLLCLLLMITACAPAGNTERGGHEQITVSFPEDDSVNGYRLPEESTVSSAPPQSSSQPSIVSSSEANTDSSSASVNTNSSSQENKTEIYIGNKNTHVFHRSDCGAVKTMKEENKTEFSDRETPIADGYTPCKRCNP